MLKRSISDEILRKRKESSQPQAPEANEDIFALQQELASLETSEEETESQEVTKSTSVSDAILRKMRLKRKLTE